MRYKIYSKDGEICLKITPILPKIIILSSIYVMLDHNPLFLKGIGFFCFISAVYSEYKGIEILKNNINHIVKPAFHNGLFITDNYNSLIDLKENLEYIKHHSSNTLGITSGKIEKYDYIYKNSHIPMLEEYFIFEDASHLIFINQKPYSQRVRNICKIPKEHIQNSTGSFNLSMDTIKKYYIKEAEYNNFFQIIKVHKKIEFPNKMIRVTVDYGSFT